MNYDLPKAEQ